jgi:hypothetical protein
MPNRSVFVERARQVDYVVLKYGMGRTFGEAGFYERLAVSVGVPWVAEVMGEWGVGSQDGPAHAITFADRLADQALQPGCIAAVINLEEADGGWQRDNGNATHALLDRFAARTFGRIPLFASIDTRAGRPSYPYQAALASRCSGVMPMIYPAAFKQSAERAFSAALTPLMLDRWRGREIIPTIQTYDITPGLVTDSVRALSQRAQVLAGGNFYTLGHATREVWSAALAYRPVASAPPAPPPVVDTAHALRALAEAWRKGWTAIAERGTVAEAGAYAEWWKRITQ